MVYSFLHGIHSVNQMKVISVINDFFVYELQLFRERFPRLMTPVWKRWIGSASISMCVTTQIVCVHVPCSATSTTCLCMTSGMKHVI